MIPDQFFDRTRGRVSTFFGRGLVAHVGFAHPFCAPLSAVAYDAARAAGLEAGGDASQSRTPAVHMGGAYVCMEGPQFSTLAESRLYRAWGMDVIGMTNLQEAKLAREAEICYATIAMATDYDCWHEGHDDVTVEGILAVMRKNIGNARQLIMAAAPKLAPQGDCPDGSALKHAIMTSPDRIPVEARLRLQLLIGKYAEPAR